MTPPINETGEHIGSNTDTPLTLPHVQLSLQSQQPPVNLKVLDKNITLTFVAATKKCDASTQTKTRKQRTTGMQTGENMPAQPIMTIFNRKTKITTVRRVVSDDWFKTKDSSSDDETLAWNYKRPCEEDESNKLPTEASLTLVVHIAPSLKEKSSGGDENLEQKESTIDQDGDDLKVLMRKSSSDSSYTDDESDKEMLAKATETPSSAPLKAWSPKPGPSGLCKFKDTKTTLTAKDYDSSSEESLSELSKYYDPNRAPSGVVIKEFSPQRDLKQKTAGNPISKPPTKRRARSTLKMSSLPKKRGCRALRNQRQESPSPPRNVQCSLKVLAHTLDTHDDTPSETRKSRSRQREHRVKYLDHRLKPSNKEKQASDEEYKRFMLNKIHYLKSSQKPENADKQEHPELKRDSEFKDNDETNTKRQRTTSE